MLSKQTNSNRHGFAHLLLLLGVVILAVVALLYFVVFKKSGVELSNLYQYPATTPSVTIAPQSLEDQANSIPDEDPSEDFKEVDTDISNL